MHWILFSFLCVFFKLNMHWTFKTRLTRDSWKSFMKMTSFSSKNHCTFSRRYKNQNYVFIFQLALSLLTPPPPPPPLPTRPSPSPPSPPPPHPSIKSLEKNGHFSQWLPLQQIPPPLNNLGFYLLPLFSAPKPAHLKEANLSSNSKPQLITELPYRLGQCGVRKNPAWPMSSTMMLRKRLLQIPLL